MKELTASQVSIRDAFWSPRLAVNAEKAIFHQWEQLEATRCIDNFRIAAGEKDGFREAVSLQTRMPTNGWMRPHGSTLSTRSLSLPP